MGEKRVWGKLIREINYGKKVNFELDVKGWLGLYMKGSNVIQTIRNENERVTTNFH